MESMPFPTQAMPMRHAFLVLGTETIFLCHQIMSHMEGHNSEFIIEVTLEDDVKHKILEDRKNGRSHFIGNQDEDLFTLAKIKSRNKLTFKADIWNAVPDQRNPPSAPWGDPEEGVNIAPWLGNIQVTVERIVHYRHVNLNSTTRTHEQYILFGKGEEAHICHSIIWQPEYDHVATLASVPNWISQNQLQASVIVATPDLPWHNDRTQCDIPLKSGAKYRVLYFGIEEYFDPNGGSTGKVPEYFIEIGTTYWYSMRVINFFNATYCPNSPQVCKPT